MTNPKRHEQCLTCFFDRAKGLEGDRLTPDIILTSETTATGSWALFDVYFQASGRSDEDEYVRTDDGWKIKSTKLTLEGAAS